MKKVLLGLALFGYASVGFAEQPLVINKEIPKNMKTEKSTTLSADRSEEQYCKSILSMAKTIMDARQSGVSIDRSLEIIDDLTKNSDFFNKVTKQLVMDAYDQPSFSTEKYKREQLNDFTAKHYISCMKAAGQF